MTPINDSQAHADGRKPQKPPRKKRDWSDVGSLPYDRIPAFKAAYSCYKECLQRFRNVPSGSKEVAREIRSRLMRVMVCIAHARLNIRVLESLREATDLAIEVQVTIRVLTETHGISVKDYANISQYSENLVRQMTAWSQSEERKAAQEQAADTAIMASRTPITPSPPGTPQPGNTAESKPQPPMQQSLFP